MRGFSGARVYGLGCGVRLWVLWFWSIEVSCLVYSESTECLGIALNGSRDCHGLGFRV